LKKTKYNFKIKDGIAEGTLPDGTKFLIDKNMVEIVSQYRFHLNWKGYPYVMKNKKYKHNIMLHWLILGYDKRPNFLVDHINRNKTDCRIANLRIVSNQQNCMNRGIGKRNNSGYRGVFYNKHRHCYQAKISINCKQIYLFVSNDKTECAQAYNYASELLFKNFAGYKNDVEETSDFIKQIIYEKCAPYLNEAEIATQLCGDFL